VYISLYTNLYHIISSNVLFNSLCTAMKLSYSHRELPHESDSFLYRCSNRFAHLIKVPGSCSILLKEGHRDPNLLF
jgi:hypothetical protein